MGFELGVLGKPLKEQFDEQDLKYDYDFMRIMESKRKALNTIKFMDLFTNGQIDKAYDKLGNEIIKHIHKLNN